MGKKAQEPLELKKGISLFRGDWERLTLLLAPKNIPPGLFIRHLVRNKILELESAKATLSRPVEISDDDILTTIGNQPELT